MRDAALAAIGAYQRYVSPHKGFCCAYRAHTGRASCSVLGARVIRRWGVWPGLQLLRQRLSRCGDAHRRCASRVRQGAIAAQRGDCDLGFLPDDPGCCDAVDCCDCGDCGSRERRPTKARDRKRERRAAPTRRWDGSADADAGRRRDG